MTKILKLLRGNDRRSIGKSNAIVSIVGKNEILFKELFEFLYSENKIIRMRAADAIQKITELNPNIIKKYKNEILHKISKIDQQEVRWHVAQLIPHLGLTKAETIIVYQFLNDYLNDKSKIVRTFSLQAMTDLTEINSSLKKEVIKIIKQQMRKGSPAILSRGKKLLIKLESKEMH